jgi:hypothetical protein
VSGILSRVGDGLGEVCVEELLSMLAFFSSFVLVGSRISHKALTSSHRPLEYATCPSYSNPKDPHSANSLDGPAATQTTRPLRVGFLLG